MLIVANYHEFTVVQRKIVCKIFLKDNSDNLFFSHDQSMPMSLNMISIFKFILNILRNYFSIENKIDMRYMFSRIKCGNKVFPGLIRSYLLPISHMPTVTSQIILRHRTVIILKERQTFLVATLHLAVHLIN